MSAFFTACSAPNCPRDTAGYCSECDPRSNFSDLSPQRAAGQGYQTGFQAGLKRGAEIASSVKLGEDLIRISMGAEINHVKLWSIMSRSIEQAILKEMEDG